MDTRSDEILQATRIVKATKLQHILSYIIPVKIWTGSGTHNSVLELFLSGGEWQLSTEDAIYSDGSRYRPLVRAFKRIRHQLPGVRKVLLLGSGIGSGVVILDRMGFHPEFVLVDADQKVLDLGKELLGEVNIRYVCSDAAAFVEACSETFDILVIDVFEGRVVPAFVSNEIFIEKCRRLVHHGGTIVINYMLNNEEDMERYLSIKEKWFPQSEPIDLGLNKILVATV